jgi:hypothetical protein
LLSHRQLVAHSHCDCSLIDSHHGEIDPERHSSAARVAAPTVNTKSN